MQGFIQDFNSVAHVGIAACMGTTVLILYT